MRAAIYCRVSTSGQAENGTSLDSQREACQKLATERGYEISPDCVFVEDLSGADLDRPKLERARELVRANEVDALICYAVDRLARNPIHVGIVAEECAKREAELIFVLEPLDNSPEGALIRYVKGYAAQIERERIKERTMRGKRTRARMGFLVQGTGKGMYGYHYMPETKKREINEAEAIVVRQVFEACLQGTSNYSIAVSLNEAGIPAFGGGLWHPQTVGRMLTNSSYKGTTVYGKTRRVSLGGKRWRLEQRKEEDWIEVPGATPAIVSTEVFDAVQQARGQRRRSPNLASRRYLLTGHVKCTCGSPLVGTCLSRTYRYYRCRATWPTTIRPRTCDARYFRADVLESQVWTEIRELVDNPEVFIAEMSRHQKDSPLIDGEIARIQGAIRRLGDQERRLIRLFGIGNVTEEYVLGEVEKVKSAQRGLERDLRQLEQQKQGVANLDGLSEHVRSFCAEMAGNLDGYDFDEKRMALDGLNIAVVADSAGVSLKGAITYDLATTAQTSA